MDLTIFSNFGGVLTGDLPIIKEAEDLTNIGLESVISKAASPDATEELFNLMIASGDMADIVHHDIKRINYFGRQGAFIPLNGLIKEHGPNIAKFLEERPTIRRIITASDGNIYTLPFVRPDRTQYAWWIRTDWLNKLDLEIPNTVDEYYQVLKAFREQDPNGNGKKDEAPFITRSWDGYSFPSLMMLWKARVYRTAWYADENGYVKYGPLDPEFKTGISNIAKWYEEGLIDPEVYTRGGTARDFMISKNLGGSTIDWFGSTSALTAKYEDVVPGLSFDPIAPPAGVDGVRRESSSQLPIRGDGWAISHSNNNPVETIKYFDFWLSETGHMLFNFGIEGETYEMVDGNPIYTELITELNKLGDYGCQLGLGAVQDIRYQVQMIRDNAIDMYTEYNEEDYPMDRFPLLSYTAEEQKTIDKIEPVVDTYIEEMVQKWILGAEDIEDNYDEFKERLNNLGIEKLIGVQQKAYDRYINN